MFFQIAEKTHMPSTLEATSEKLTERIEQPGVTVGTDANDWVIRNVVVLNRESKNGRRYLDTALRDVSRLAERNPVAIEHEDEKGRRYMDRNGQLRKPRVDGTRVVADYHLNENHPTSKQIRTDAEKFPENLCLSIEIDQDQWEGQIAADGVLEVSHVKELLDTSIVARGGTTRSLYESQDPPTPPRKKRSKMSENKDLERQLDAKIREAEERRKSQDERDKLIRDLEDQKALNAKLTEQVNAYKAQEARTAKVAKIQERAKQLKAGEISADYASSLAKLEEAEIDVLLQERAKLLETSQQSSGWGSPSPDPPSVGGTTIQSGSTDSFSWMNFKVV